MRLGNHIKKLEEEKEQLKQQLADAQVEAPAAVMPPASASVYDTTKSWKALADCLNRDDEKIREERAQLQD